MQSQHPLPTTFNTARHSQKQNREDRPSLSPSSPKPSRIQPSISPNIGPLHSQPTVLHFAIEVRARSAFPHASVAKTCGWNALVAGTVLVIEAAVEFAINYEVVDAAVSVGALVARAAAEGWEAAHCGGLNFGCWYSVVTGGLEAEWATLCEEREYG